MTFQFFLPKRNLSKNLYLNITDASRNINYHFNTHLQMNENEWDFQLERPKNIYLKKQKLLNEKINLLKLEIKEYIEKKSTQVKSVSQRSLSKKIREICARREDQFPENSLLYYMQAYIKSKENLICKSTFKRYNVFFKLLVRFEAHMTERMMVDTLSSDFTKDFIQFGKKEKYSDNTIYRTIHFVKTILNFAERKGIRTSVREIVVKRKKQNKEMITLTEKEILMIKSTTVPSVLEIAKDWLIISCYTGQRFSDFINFSSEQLVEIEKKICIKFTQQKTRKSVMLPLHPIVLNILNKYDDQFPRRMDINEYNNAIKEIAKLSNLDELVNTRKRCGFRANDIEVEKWKAISSHIGRRSFATNFYGKIPTPLLMEATGHSTEQMFLKYINPVNTDRILSLGKYFDQAHADRGLIPN